MKADKESAAAGETVQLTVTPDEGYELEAIGVTYTDGNGQTQNVTVNKDNTFEMPAGDVNVTASFKVKKQLHSVTVTVKDNQGGTATAEPNQAVAGQTVKLNIQAEEGWLVWSVTVNSVTMNKELEPDPNTKKDYQFVMPDEDVEVVVKFDNPNSPAPEA